MTQCRRLERLQAIREEHAGVFWPAPCDNPENCHAYGRLAEWFVRQVGQVDCLVGCAGSGGSLCGTAAILREIFPDLVVLAVDTPRVCSSAIRPESGCCAGLVTRFCPECGPPPG
ncbi:pyridoxal-phosphate dependent enzyme [Bradyrhizobium sp. CCBAU 65884]|uniref:pyridoxal-phosphate dependent enzyme n=1 Tax=Bradyrhizobium sp. CCBAU 65884 TaxID=722477 RepID=UPI002305BD74|nr:pyridoxal-phosphate dependent enzyme [Bradyrhizobium sp. CCBAU 65884]